MKIFQKNLLFKIMFLVTAMCVSVNSIQADTIINSDSPVIDGDDAGNFVAVWQGQDLDTATTVILASRFLISAGVWSTPIIISDTAQIAQNPLVSMNALGNTIVVWTSTDTNSITWLQTANLPYGIDGSGTWSGITNISTADDLVYPDPTSYNLRMDNVGNILVVWTEEGLLSGLTSIKASTSVFGGGWTTIVVSDP